jgi:hypothetical protein
VATTSKSAVSKAVKPAEKPAAKPKSATAKVEKVAAAKPKTTKTTTTAPKLAAKPKAAAPAKKVATPAKAAPKKSPAKPKITPDQYRAYIEVAAYHIAERRGFVGGNAQDDWAQAEAEINRLLSEGILKP